MVTSLTETSNETKIKVFLRMFVFYYLSPTFLYFNSLNFPQIKHCFELNFLNLETAKFYKALSMIGTDFTMIQRLFSHRNRDEIKRKFKREEKLNQALIDKILSKTAEIDLSVFVSDSSDNEERIKTVLSKNKAKSPVTPKNDVNAGVKQNKKKKANVKETLSAIESLQTDASNANTKNRKKLKRIEKSKTKTFSSVLFIIPIDKFTSIDP